MSSLDSASARPNAMHSALTCSASQLSASGDTSSCQELCIRPDVQTTQSSSESAVRFGCSECVCVAIESHRPDLLIELLSRSDVVHRDMFWAPGRPFALRQSRHIRPNEYFPVLHLIKQHDDPSQITSGHCGHDIVDEELRGEMPVEFWQIDSSCRSQ